jgi:hypothetical protein
MNRREMLAFLAAGGVVTASGLWWPGQKLISIPKDHVIGGQPLTIMLTHFGKVVHQWTEMCTEKNGVWDAPDRSMKFRKRTVFDSVSVKNPYGVGPKTLDLGLSSGGGVVYPSDTLTLQWSVSGILSTE